MDPLTAAETALLHVVPVLVVLGTVFVLANGRGLVDHLRVRVRRSRVGWGFFAVVLLVAYLVTVVAFLDGAPTWDEDFPPTMLGFPLLALGLGLTGYALAGVPAYRTLQRATAADCHDLPDGPVLVTGTAEADRGTTTSPTGVACLAWEERVERESKTVDHVWLLTETRSEAVPFRVDDGTGTVRVDPDGAQFALATDEWSEADDGETRTSECRLEPGDEVTVVGGSDGHAVSGAGVGLFAIGDGDGIDPAGEPPGAERTMTAGNPMTGRVGVQVRRGIPLGVVLTLAAAWLLFAL